MTDREKLEKIQEEVMTEENSYERMKKVSVLEKLIASTDSKTGKISTCIIIPFYEHKIEFLKQIMENLGYSPSYEEKYNHFWKTTCCVVQL